MPKQLGCTRGVLANEESVDEHFDVVEGAEHGRCEDRSETNAGYLFPLATGLLILRTGTFHLLGSKAEHATTAWRLFGGLLLVLAIVVVRLIRKRLAAAYINTAIGRMVFVGLFSYLVGKTGNPAYVLILIVLSCGEAWTLVALAVDLRELLSSFSAKRLD